MDDPRPDEFSALKGYSTDPPRARFTPPGSGNRQEFDGFSPQDTVNPDRSNGIPEALPDGGHGMTPAPAGGYVTGALLRVWRWRRASRWPRPVR